jgi:hypothetical protein
MSLLAADCMLDHKCMPHGINPSLIHQVVSVTSEKIDRVNTELKVGVTRLGRSQQNVGVDKNTHQAYILSRLHKLLSAAIGKISRASPRLQWPRG